jgi:hypothetical protein
MLDKAEHGKCRSANSFSHQLVAYSPGCKSLWHEINVGSGKSTVCMIIYVKFIIHVKFIVESGAWSALRNAE